ncbi:HlyD family secretion protein [Shewanella algae]|uniref:HlyD family secretion protein n=1 Tax=Shewanella algae TaxID=38313 RepID=UPI001AAE4148|nr:HlyD family efflux transporter periplasmic adaptor subunit [Shewanella algae]MBO2581832.1 HlyD family efflux transporter periplasmic adaptor subunit [Shewanella algae]MCE9785857.1 HlyD family efflux transporter periplasmic adaptor subunit [Shewanella algae]
MNGLFRKEALDYSNKRLLGSVSLAQPLSVHFWVFTVFLSVLSIISFLYFSEYARKETVRGYLLPDAGIIKTYPVKGGVVTELHVKEGDNVVYGQPIAVISVQSGTASGEEIGEKIVSSLLSQKAILLEEKQQQRQLHQSELSRLKQRKTDLAISLSVFKRQSEIMTSRLTLLKTESEQYSTLHGKGYLSDIDYTAQKQKLLIAEQDLEEVNANKASVSSELNQINAELASNPIQFELTIVSLEKQLVELQRQIDEINNTYRFVITAPESGVIAAVSIVQGEFVAATRPLVSIIPEGAELVAELLLPTRSAGFVREGDEARLRFDAFPYQRFGFLESQVARIDKALIVEGEASLPITLNEPVYRVRTILSAQSVQAYGESFNLKSGMLLEADIVLDRRSIFDWLLDPIYSLRGRVG